MSNDDIYFYQLEDDEYFTMHCYPGELFKKLDSGTASRLTGAGGIIPMDTLERVVRW